MARRKYVFEVTPLIRKQGKLVSGKPYRIKVSAENEKQAKTSLSSYNIKGSLDPSRATIRLLT
jgi:hypothetical protein